MTLEERLKEIVGGVYGSGLADGQLDQPYEDDDISGAVAQIIQAFKESGEWVHVNASPDTQAAIANTMLGNPVMTGQEWYDRFKREYEKTRDPYGLDTDDFWNAAKRASEL